MQRKLPSGNNFEAIKKIGKGSYGSVYLGKSLKTKENCAIKRIDLRKTRNLENARKKVNRELEVMKRVKHENCVELFFIEPKNYQNADLIYVVMEYCDKGDLSEYLDSKKEKNKKLSIEEIKGIFRQIVLGLKYLHQKRIVHRDLKPKNIILQSNQNQSNPPYFHIQFQISWILDFQKRNSQKMI
ncbi:serine/threonine-protein kinase nek1 [Anaeramoeba ignava]|uniref:non-specific serine/threonine protein kinase n=1 Tax=Anaeramoeba ignava TaxID=1746090 RepID=A0A9Q0LWK0_ANAIG|nr:serine/threonine-protein kinase nek1 [Anaeramoeba ignava]